ncbi:MAG: hypothetical protein SVO01_01455 [Thermotogota bacterium]|nr:hypothetical protein [Thermotogota bacterium]
MPVSIWKRFLGFVKKKYSNSKTRGFCYTVIGDKVPDEFVIAELIKIREHLNVYVSKHYLKTLGFTKLCAYFKKSTVKPLSNLFTQVSKESLCL